MSGNVRTLLIAAQIAVSIACFGFLAVVIDWPGALVALNDLGFASLVGGASVFLSAQFLAAWRMQLVLKAVGVDLPFGEAARLCWLGLASSNVLPSTIGGDVLIVMALSRFGRSVVKSITGLVLNRVISLLATLLCLPTVLLVPKLVGVTQAIRPTSLVIFALLGLAIVVVSIIGLRLRPRLAKRWSLIREMVESCRNQTGLMAGTLVISISILGLGAITIQLLLPDLSGKDTFVPILAIVSLVMIAQLIPISFNGLGIQESLLTTCLSMVGWTLESAAVAAIAVRFITIGVSLPGLLWISFLWRRRTEPVVGA
ncbi:lysylphosphatidylglycerol synthase transmembrane domain-containing protein [Microvirga rosea]|uniref:lysylphosphatidylglycerol synthase transmembrane domain-containing protein n=1 Tax=Microvirga rosea TaxID=2715425 RepID=UPI001D0AA2AE|nr:lysylphosphatidylglycerol synthase transmembrane domain-containing protein [Microvirga rosea]MCB8820195.1 flippase-like domain-containing protein [Microvirga rosea]